MSRIALLSILLLTGCPNNRSDALPGVGGHGGTGGAMDAGGNSDASGSTDTGGSTGSGGGAGAGGTGAGGTAGSGGSDDTQYFLQRLNNQIDILFVVDNSPSMETLQTHLAANFPDFVGVLKGLPAGLPDVHVGVVSTDLGTGQVTSSVPGCGKQPYGDQGMLQNSPGWSYTWNAAQNKFTSARKTCIPPSGKFISASGGIGTEGTTNYTGTLAEAFSCIASIGSSGCGFEHVLGAMERALGVDPWFPSPPENQGFLRPDAYLGIVLITNEDDCSAPPDSILFDPTSHDLTGEFGPLSSYRCNRFGHSCNGSAPPAAPSDPRFAGGSTYAPTSCRSLEDGTLLRVSDVIRHVSTAKANRSMIFVGAMAGPPSPYVVGLDSTTPPLLGYADQQWPKILPSCTVADTSVAGPAGTADPAVRLKQFVDGMGGVFESVCGSNFGLALTNVANALARRVGVQCLAAKVRDGDLLASGLQPSCTVVDRQVSAGIWVETPLPQCSDPSGAAPTNQPCWYLTTDTRCPSATAQQVMRVSRSTSSTLSPGAEIAVHCASCAANDSTPGCSY